MYPLNFLSCESMYLLSMLAILICNMVLDHSVLYTRSRESWKQSFVLSVTSADFSAMEWYDKILRYYIQVWHRHFVCIVISLYTVSLTEYHHLKTIRLMVYSNTAVCMGENECGKSGHWSVLIDWLIAWLVLFHSSR